jgi:hypothetical protein
MVRNVAAGRLRTGIDTTAAVAGADTAIIILSSCLGTDYDMDYCSHSAARTACAAGPMPGTMVFHDATLSVRR